MKRQRFRYMLLSKLTEEEYEKFPEEVRKVYISAAKGIPMDKKEKLAIILRNPDYFDKAPEQSFSTNVKRMISIKTKLEKDRQKNIPKKVFYASKDEVSFPEPQEDAMDIGKIWEKVKSLENGN